MIQQAFKAGQKVSQIKKAPSKDDTIYTVITAEPVFKKVALNQRLKNVVRLRKTNNEIVNYKYRCKSKEDMKDFLQDEITNR